MIDILYVREEYQTKGSDMRTVGPGLGGERGEIGVRGWHSCHMMSKGGK